MSTKGWAVCALLFSLIVPFAVYVPVVTSMTKWSESRMVSDDFCYLRQAQLFQRNGIWGGLDTNLDSEPLRYLVGKSEELGLGPSADFANLPCHRVVEATNKRSMQYPPGTGFLLSLFSEGLQVRALYIASATAVLLIILCSVLTARTASMSIMAGAVGGGMLYLMINPAKASHSLAPTMPICMALALLTVWMFVAKRAWVRLACTVAAAFLLGAAVNIRAANAILLAGYLVILAMAFIRAPSRQEFLRAALFSIAFVIGTMPTLAANAINAGSPWTTPYGEADVAHHFAWAEIKERIQLYATTGTNGVLLWTATAGVVLFCVKSGRLNMNSARQLAWLMSTNLILNLAYFLTHAGTTTYYTVPVCILSIWTVVFAFHASEYAMHSAEDSDKLRIAPGPLRGALAMIVATATAAYVSFVPGRIEKEIWPKTSDLIDRSAVVWAHLSAGLIHLHFDRHAAAGLAESSPPEIQDMLLASIAKDGRQQLFVQDGQPMQGLIERAARLGTLRPVGQVFGQDVYKLEPRE